MLYNLEYFLLVLLPAGFYSNANNQTNRLQNFLIGPLFVVSRRIQSIITYTVCCMKVVYKRMCQIHLIQEANTSKSLDIFYVPHLISYVFFSFISLNSTILLKL